MNIRTFIIVIKDILRSRSMAGATLTLLLLATLPQPAQAYDNDSSFTPTTTVGSGVPVETLYAVCDASSSEASVTVSYSSAFSVLGVSLAQWTTSYSNTFYMRWFVVDASATNYTASSVTASTSGWDIQPAVQTISYNSDFNIYGAGENHQYGAVADCKANLTTDDFESVAGCTYTIPSGTDVSQYKLVCFISYTGTSSATYVQTSTDREITAVAEFQLLTSADDLPFNAGGTASIGSANTAEVMTVVDASTTTATMNAYSEVYDSNTSSFNLGLTSPYYIRWYMEDVATGEVIDTSNHLFATSKFTQNSWETTSYYASDYYSHRSGFYVTYPQTNFAFTYDNWGNITPAPTILQAALDGMQVTYADGLTNVRVHCLLSTTEPTTASGYVVTEPDFDAEVIFYFKTKEQIEADYTASDANEDGASEKAITKVLVDATTSTDNTYVVTSDNWSESGGNITITYDNLAVATDLGVLGSYADKIYYMRWVELDANGDPVTNSDDLFSGLESNINEYTGDAAYHYNSSTGYHIIYSKLSTEHFTISNLIEELNKSVTLTNFDATHSIEFVLSTTMPGLTTDDSGDLVLFSEPPYDLKITYNYLHADDVATYFYPAESTALTTLTQTQVISAAEELDSTTTINAYTDLSTDLSSVTAKYIRWCVLDADGNIITSYSGFSSTGGYSSADCFVNKTKDGTVYTITSSDGLTLSSVLNNMSVSVPLVNGSNSGYKVVALIASSTPQTYYDTQQSAYVLNEPAFDVKIEYTLLTASDIEAQYKAALTDASATYTLNSSVSLSSSVSINAFTLAKATYNGWTPYSDYITNSTSTYVRWYITDDAGEIIDATGLFSNSVADSYYQDWGGTYVCSNVSSSSSDYNYIQNLLNNITVSGSTLAKGYQIICLVSTDADGATTIGGYVSEEPSSFTLKIVYTIVNDGKFHHYIGYEFDSLGYSDNESTSDEAYLKVNGGIRQQTNEWTYYRYVEPGETIQLINRFDDVKTTTGEVLEPQGYFRWYDYNTDYASDCLSTNSSFGNMLNLEFYEDGYGYRGLFSYANSQDSLATAARYAAVNFTAPTDASWEETIIACDVSKYVDGIVEDTSASNPAVVFQHEPTLSMRYKFVVRPNTAIADHLKDALINDHVPYEDNKYLTFGLKSNGSGRGQVRTELQRTSDYWFYPCSAPDEAYCDDSYEFEDSHFTTTAPVQAKAVMWRAYYNDEAYVDLSAVTCSFDNSKFAHQQELELSTLASSISWKDFDGNSATVPSAVIGSAYELIAFAIDGTSTSDYTNKCPVARYIVRFLSEAPEPFDSLDSYRTIDYLEETYTRQAVISFDSYEGSNLSQPETVLVNGNGNAYGIDNMSYSAYGYCYPGLYKYEWQYASSKYMGLSPMHGDYVLLKSMNLSGVSTSETSLTGTDGNTYMYRWWHKSSELRDRTYLDYSNGAQAGYFVYIDAAEEARPIVSVPFEADLCTGSCLVFTAAVTDMTSAQTAPQLMFELFGLDTDDEGNETARHPIHKFNTCDFSTVCDNEKGTWYQVYGKVYLQKAAAVENYSDFLVQITNYANDTQGADYAIDDIRFYTQNAKIEVTQSNAICGETGAILRMKIAYNTLVALIDDLTTSSNEHFLLYKICNEDGSDYTDITFPVTKTYYSILEINKLKYQTDANGQYVYDDNGYIALDSSCAAQYNADGTLSVPGYEYDTEGVLYYVFANNDFKLPSGKTFYISAASKIFEQGVANGYIEYDFSSRKYTLDSNADFNALEWGSPSTACSLYSNMFTPAQQSVLVIDADGATVTQVSFDCTDTNTISPSTLSAQIKIPTSSGTFVTYPTSSTDGLRIDWIITSAEGYAKLTEEVNGTTLLDSLDTALSAFREDCPNATDLSSWTSGSTNYTADRYNLLYSYINGTATPDTASATVYAKVFLTQTYTLTTSNLGLEVNNTYYFIARAYATGADGETSLTVDGTAYELCSDLMMTTLSTTYTGPEMAIGFDDVVYPSSRDANIGNVRLGLFHLDDMKNNGAHLHVPVNSISNSSSYSGTDKLLTVDTNITLASTTDPLAESYVGQTVGWVGQTTIGTSSSNKFVDILFKSGTDTTPLTFHEGYEYELCVLFADDGQSTTSSNLCTGNAYITLKVVPEYVTWTGAQATNTNWNNDANWTRSTKEELYKTGTGNYTDDSEIFSTVSDYAQPQTYVPLKFTKATIPSGATQWPYLASVSVDHNTGIVESLINRDGSAATSLIEYDMVAKVEQGCEHSGTGTIYDCEKFYANTCDQIYFKPRTQLLLQHYLTYNYAWVEQQLASGEWYILGAPLKDTYAGDMYVPANSSFQGMQKTQAFEPITFKYCSYNSTSTATDTIYNRSTFPIYQRSWDKSVSKEVTPKGDSRGEYYDAFRKSVTASASTELDAYSATELQWSHTYNDVTEKYTNGLGYSLRADNKADYLDAGHTYRDSALIRLPKADKEYTYYFYDDYKDTDNGSGKVSKDNYGRFATNATDATDGSYTPTGLIYATPDALQSDGDYYLLSNPYMSSLYASAFLTRNTMFDSSKIWYVSGGAITGVTVDNSTKLGPMQAFFVKKADGATIDNSTQVAYTLTMTLSSSVASTASAASALSKQTQLTVESGNGKSTVAIVLDDDADSDFFDDEDIETLFDTNLSDRPTLYTVAGSQTVLLNRTDAIGYIPLGVVEDEDEELTLTVSGTENLGTTLYLVDAVDGVSTELTDDATVTLRSNDHGRYFITSELFSPDGEEEYANAIRCYSPQPGTIVCTSATGDNLQDITVYTSSGMTVTNLRSVDNVSATINVGSRGVYVVRLTTDNAPNGVSVKVVVK